MKEINTTAIIEKIPTTQIKETSGTLAKQYLNHLLEAPVWISVVTFLFLVIFFIVIKQFLDQMENSSQNFVWKSFINVSVFIGGLIILFLADAGEFILLNKFT